MGYDLDFWRFKKNVNLGNQQTYEQLSDGKHVEGLEELPIADILRRVSEVFERSGWKRIDELNWRSAEGAFQVFTTSQFFRVDCYGMSGDDMNLIIEIASEFNCPLYDPQVGQRFDGHSPDSSNNPQGTPSSTSATKSQL